MISSTRSWLRSRNRWLLVVLAGLLYGLPLFTFEGFGAAYMKLGDIKGEATDSDHKDWIIIDSFSWGLSQTGSTTTGGGTGKVSMQDLSFTKKVDKSSPLLMLRCAKGERLPEGLVSYTKQTERGPVVFLKLRFSDLLISGYKFHGNSDALPTDQLSLNFTKIEMTYIPVDAKGEPGEPVTAEVDLSPAE
jgi:type VI secretion system secreted protein Hcp